MGLKIQSRKAGGSWEFSTRVAGMLSAWVILYAYRREYPNEKHRLVMVAESTGEVTVIPDNEEELAQIKADDEADYTPDPLAKLEVSKLSDIVGKTIVSAELYGDGVEIRFTDNTLCIFLPTSDEKLMFTTGDYVS